MGTYTYNTAKVVADYFKLLNWIQSKWYNLFQLRWKVNKIIVSIFPECSDLVFLCFYIEFFCLSHVFISDDVIGTSHKFVPTKSISLNPSTGQIWWL